MKLIHTDLKVENVLFCRALSQKSVANFTPDDWKVKVIDFGGATYDDEHKSRIINTRQYVVLAMHVQFRQPSCQNSQTSPHMYLSPYRSCISTQVPLVGSHTWLRVELSIRYLVGGLYLDGNFDRRLILFDP